MLLSATKLYIWNERLLKPRIIHPGMYSCAYKHSTLDLDLPGPGPGSQMSHKQHSYTGLKRKSAALAKQAQPD